jgi:hypothetical protein
MDKYLVIAGRGCGFFSLFTQVLTILEPAWLAQYAPSHKVIIFFNSYCYYWIPEGWNGSKNMWEYYFEPVSDALITDAIQCEESRLMHLNIDEIRSLVDASHGMVVNQHVSALTGFAGLFNEDNRVRIKKIIDDRIKVKQSVLGLANAFFCRHMVGRKVVGIHFRGTDKRRELEAHVPGYKVFHQIDAYIDAIPREYDDALVFLATDSLDALAAARRRLGSRLIFQEHCVRSADEAPIHLPNFPYNNARQGEEAIVDWLVLTRCDYFVHGVSNFSAAVLFMAPTLPHHDMYAR